MKTLSEVSLVPREPQGWSSGDLRFGDTITLILGPNGSGKTPIVRALMYGMGYRIALPELVVQKCREVTVVLYSGAERATLRRTIADAFEIEVQSAGETKTFVKEGDFSKWIVAFLKLELREFLSKDGAVVPPYIGVLAPIFYVDQDRGWIENYAALDSQKF